MQRIYEESRRLAESAVTIRQPWLASHSHLCALVRSAREGIIAKDAFCRRAPVDTNFDTVPRHVRNHRETGSVGLPAYHAAQRRPEPVRHK
jgi:hypothetical protein